MDPVAFAGLIEKFGAIGILGWLVYRLDLRIGELAKSFNDVTRSLRNLNITLAGKGVKIDTESNDER